MTERKKFFRTSYKTGSFVNPNHTARSGSFKNTVDTDTHFEHTATNFAKTKQQGFTSRLSHRSTQHSFRPEKTGRPSEYGLSIYKPVAQTDYGKRRIDPFVLSSGNHGQGFIELTERSMKDIKPYKIGTRNFSHGEIPNYSGSNSKALLSRLNTEPKNLLVPATLKTLSAREATSKRELHPSLANLEQTIQPSDFMVKKLEWRKDQTVASLDQQ